MSSIPVFTLRDISGRRKKLTYNEAICLVDKQTVDALVTAVISSGRKGDASRSCEAGKYGQLIVTLNEQL